VAAGFALAGLAACAVVAPALTGAPTAQSSSDVVASPAGPGGARPSSVAPSLSVAPADARAVDIGRRARASMDTLTTLTITYEAGFVRSGALVHDHGYTTRIEVPDRRSWTNTPVSSTVCGAGFDDVVLVGADEWLRSPTGAYMRYDDYVAKFCTNIPPPRRTQPPYLIPIRDPLLTSGQGTDLHDWEAIVRFAGLAPCATGTCFRLTGVGMRAGKEWRSETLIDATTYNYVSQQFDDDTDSGTFRERYDFSESNTPVRIRLPG
jgi:hypothetical protein